MPQVAFGMAFAWSGPTLPVRPARCSKKVALSASTTPFHNDSYGTTQFSDVVGWLTRSGGVRCPQLLAIPAGSPVGDSRPERDQARGHCLSLSVAGRGSFRPAGAGPALTRSFPPGASLLTDHASVASRAPGWFPVLFRKHLAGKGLGGTPKSGGRPFADPLRCDRSMAGF